MIYQIGYPENNVINNQNYYIISMDRIIYKAFEALCTPSL